MKRLMRKAMEDTDPIKQAVKQHGFIKTVTKDDLYYPEYKEFSRSVIMRYFRRDGIPIDNFADILGVSLADLMEDLRTRW